MAAVHGVRGTGMMTHPTKARLTKIAASIEAGTVRLMVSSPRDAVHAYELAGRGHTRGKAVMHSAPPRARHRVVDSNGTTFGVGTATSAGLAHLDSPVARVE